MKNKRNKLLLIALILISGITNAQENSIATEETKKNSVALYGGFPGFGLGYGRQLNDHLSLRLKGSIFSYNVLKNGLALGSRTVDLEGTFKFNTVDLLLDYLPFKKSSFKLVAGLSYLTTAKASIVIKPASETKYGDIVLSKDQIGQINTGADWSGVTPYLAFGFGRAIPKNNFGFGFEIGGYFVGKPDFSFDATKMLAPTADIEKENNEFQSWMDKFTFIPNIMLHVNYKL